MPGTDGASQFLYPGQRGRRILRLGRPARLPVRHASGVLTGGCAWCFPNTRRSQAVRRSGHRPPSPNIGLIEESAATRRGGRALRALSHSLRQARCSRNPEVLRYPSAVTAAHDGPIGAADLCGWLAWPKHKEMIATLVSTQNACPYCADSHGYLPSRARRNFRALAAIQANDLELPGVDDCRTGLCWNLLEK